MAEMLGDHMQDGTEFGALSVGTKTEQEDNSVSRSPCKAVLPFRPVPFRPVPTRPLAARSVGSLTLPPPPPRPPWADLPRNALSAHEGSRNS